MICHALDKTLYATKCNRLKLKYFFGGEEIMHCLLQVLEINSYMDSFILADVQMPMVGESLSQSQRTCCFKVHYSVGHVQHEPCTSIFSLFLVNNREAGDSLQVLCIYHLYGPLANTRSWAFVITKQTCLWFQI